MPASALAPSVSSPTPGTSAAAGAPARQPLADTRAVRSAQALVAMLVAAAAIAGDWRLLLVPALHLVLAASLGRRGNLPIRAFDAWIRPRLATESWEDARPPRFANVVGAIVLSASVLAHAGGLHAPGWALAVLVGALAAVAAATGLCIGCKLYWLVALVRRVRARSPSP